MKENVISLGEKGTSREMGSNGGSNCDREGVSEGKARDYDIGGESTERGRRR